MAMDGGSMVGLEPVARGAWALPVQAHADISCNKIYLATCDADAVLLCQRGDERFEATDLSLYRFDGSGAVSWSTKLALSESEKWMAQGLVADQGHALYAAIRAPTPRQPSGLFDDPHPILGVARVECDGTVSWTKTYQASNADVHGMVVDRDGTLLLAGGFGQALDFGGQPLQSYAPQTGDRWVPDVFVARLDRSGNRIWSAQFGQYCAESADGIALTEAGEIMVVAKGVFEGTPTCPDRAMNPWSLALLDKDANLRWSRVYDDAPEPPVLFAASGKGLSVVGNVPGEIPNALSQTGESFDDIWIQSMDFDGKDLARKTFGANYNDVVSGFAIDGHNDFVLAGYTFSSGTPSPIDFGGGALKPGRSAFVVKLDGLGGHVWTRPFLHTDSADQPFPVAMALTASDEVYVAGLGLGSGAPPNASGTLYLGKLTR